MNTIEILSWMIEVYDKRGGGNSQKEALKEAIECLKNKTSEGLVIKKFIMTLPMDIRRSIMKIHAEQLMEREGK